MLRLKILDDLAKRACTQGSHDDKRAELVPTPEVAPAAGTTFYEPLPKQLPIYPVYAVRNESGMRVIMAFELCVLLVVRHILNCLQQRLVEFFCILVCNPPIDVREPCDINQLISTRFQSED